jgi:hypothetical protein
MNTARTFDLVVFEAPPPGEPLADTRRWSITKDIFELNANESGEVRMIVWLDVGLLPVDWERPDGELKRQLSLRFSTISESNRLHAGFSGRLPEWRVPLADSQVLIKFDDLKPVSNGKVIAEVRAHLEGSSFKTYVATIVPRARANKAR